MKHLPILLQNTMIHTFNMSVNGKFVCPPVWMGHEKPTPVHRVAIQSFCWGRQILIPLIFFQIKLPLHWTKRAGTHSNRALTTSASHTYKYRMCNLECDRRLRRLLWTSVTLKEIVQSQFISWNHTKLSTELQLKSVTAYPRATSHLQIPVHTELLAVYTASLY